MNILSLCDGMSCGQIALNKAGIGFKNYFASEIKKTAIRVANKNFPNTVQLGDIRNVDIYEGAADILLAGTPCQDFSIARTALSNNEIKGLEGDKSSLFYDALRIKNKLKPKYFLFENVKMKKESELELNEYLGVIGFHINSSLLTYQSRPRIYWTNIPFDKNILDKKVSFQDYIGIGNLEECKVNKTPSRLRMWNDGRGRTDLGSCDNITYSKKIGCLTTKQDRCPNSGLIQYQDFCRYLSRSEMEQAQTVPIGYTDCVSYHAACDLLGDGWTVDVISHILSALK